MNATIAYTRLCSSASTPIQDPRSSYIFTRSVSSLSLGRRISVGFDGLRLARSAPSISPSSNSSSVNADNCSSRSASSGSQLSVRSAISGIPSSHKLDGFSNTETDRSFAVAQQTLQFETHLSAKVAPQTENGFPSVVEKDPDSPTEGFSSITEAVEAIRGGKFVIVVDDEDRENEGDLIMAASLVTPERMAFMVNHCTGIVCVGMKGDALDRLNLPLMVRSQENDEAMVTAFTVSVDAREGTSTGVSASDRAKTVLGLASPESRPDNFKRPGHIFPLRACEGGVLKRAGHTEASVDLSELAGLPLAGVLCELVNRSDGSMSRLPDLQEFAKIHNLPIISIADLVRYKRNRYKLVERTAVARLPTQWGAFQAFSYTSQLDGIEHIALVKGDIGDGMDVLVRVHSECLTGDIFGSARCDCGNQLSKAMQNIEQEGRGVLVYLRGHEGRGIGLGHKLQAYNLQDAGRDTVEANVDLGLPIDSREYGIGAQILRDVGVQSMKLMTNNPSKYLGLKGFGLTISGRIPILSHITKENRKYIETKRSKMGHVYGSGISELVTNSVAMDIDSSASADKQIESS